MIENKVDRTSTSYDFTGVFLPNINLLNILSFPVSRQSVSGHSVLNVKPKHVRMGVAVNRGTLVVPKTTKYR